MIEKPLLTILDKNGIYFIKHLFYEISINTLKYTFLHLLKIANLFSILNKNRV